MKPSLHILLTGASGFVGQALARYLVGEGHRVTSLVREGASVPAGTEVLRHRLGSSDALTLPAGIDAVAHLAQSRSYRNFPGDAGEMFAVNVAGAHEMLLAAAAAGVARFCLVSSGTVYEPFVEPLDEDRVLAPTGSLGATKLAAEVISRPYATLFPISILRLFAPYGPGQTARLIPDLIGRIERGDPVSLPLSGSGMRFSPSYVDDICAVILTALQEGWSGTFNVASPEAVTIQEVAGCLADLMGRTASFERRQMGAPDLVPSLAKLGRHYDLSRFRSFSDGARATVAAQR